MNKIEKINLIEGTFSNEEAKEILVNIFSTKINYHEMKNFSSYERFGKYDKTAKKRIPELKKELEKISKIISEAKLHNKNLIINSEITIALSDY